MEALLLLVFLTGSLAVLMELNADADQAGRQSADLLDAIVLRRFQRIGLGGRLRLALGNGQLRTRAFRARPPTRVAASW